MKRLLFRWLLSLIGLTALIAPRNVDAQACLSGTVFADNDNNGIFGPADTPLAGQTVTAIGSGGAVLLATTSAGGFYEFCDPAPGNYFIYVTLSAPTLLATPASRTVNFATGQSVPNLDFAVVDLTLLGDLEGEAFFDLDGNGIRSNFEPGVAGATVTLNGPGGPLVVNTDASGRFRFDRLVSNDYSVSIDAAIPNTDWVTPTTVGTAVLPGQTTRVTFIRRVLPGFGSLIDFVCYDLDGNGINNPQTEPGIGRVQVDLVDAQGLIVNTVSDARGLYSFVGLVPGVYTVNVQFNPDDYDPTTPTSYLITVPADNFVRQSPFYLNPKRKLFKCGMEAMTFSGWTNPGNKVLSVKDIRDRTGAPVGTNMDWATVPSIDHPDWTRTRMGNVFGLAIDKDYDMYVTATDLWGAIPATPGTGLVYHVNSVTGQVTNFVEANTANPNSLPNTGRAIGNICSNPDDDLLYLTNRENGTIAVVAAFGNGTYAFGEVVQTFNPAFGGAANGQDLWGIAYNRVERRVYFARDFADGATPNEIYSIGVTGAGLITGTEVLERNVALVNAFNTHLTDIAFSQDGTDMLIGERGHPHGARMIQYVNGNQGNWAPIIPQVLFLGLGSGGANAAGGVDYAYSSFTGEEPPAGACDTYVVGSANALVLENSNNVYGTAIIPASGNALGSYANLNSIFIDSDNDVIAQDKGYIGDVEVFKCACPQEGGCSAEFGLSMTPAVLDTADHNCCWTLSYANQGTVAVGGVQISALNGVTLQYNNLAAGFQTPSFSPSSVTILPGAPGPMPAAVNDLIDICLGNVLATPQFVVINYLDEKYQTFCSDTLTFRCPPERGCLYILSDSLVCDSLGYKYTVTVKNPLGSNFPVGFIKFNVLNPTSGVTYVPGNQFVLSPPLQPGQSTTLMFLIQTNLDLYGQDFCFILSAHDDERERLCCAEIETCIPFPLCDPCPFVDVEVKPNPDVGQEDECCFELLITDQYTQDPNLFTQIQTSILTPGVTFSSFDWLPILGAGWNPPTTITPGQSYLWSHSSGVIPDVINYNLFDFCVKGVTSTDSIYMEVNWLSADGLVVCSDTVAVYCPYCLTIVRDTLWCDANGNYVYSFWFQNNSPFNVNTVGVYDLSAPNDTILNAGTFTVPLVAANGGISSVPVSIIIDGAAGPSGRYCFDIVLRQVIGDQGINILCCYATHCIELPPCETLPPFRCPNPDLVRDEPCIQLFDPVCGCDGKTYANTCYALNAGVWLWEPGPCDSIPTPDPRLPLTAALDPAGGGVQLNWILQDDPAKYDFFAASNAQWNDIVYMPAPPLPEAFSILYPAVSPGLNQFQVVAVDKQGQVLYSNIADVFVQRPADSPVVVAYPVPATSQLHVVSSKLGEATLEVISPDGSIQQMGKAEFTGAPVPVELSRLRNGVFLVRLRYTDGTIAQQRFVKVE